jgi:hypothetical protein
VSGDRLAALFGGCEGHSMLRAVSFHLSRRIPDLVLLDHDATTDFDSTRSINGVSFAGVHPVWGRFPEVVSV